MCSHSQRTLLALFAVVAGAAAFVPVSPLKPVRAAQRAPAVQQHMLPEGKVLEVATTLQLALPSLVAPNEDQVSDFLLNPLTLAFLFVLAPGAALFVLITVIMPILNNAEA